MHPIVHSLWQFLASIVIPESLSVENNQKRIIDRPKLFEHVAARKEALQPGDLIAVRTPGTFYRMFRRAANHRMDHLVSTIPKHTLLGNVYHKFVCLHCFGCQLKQMCPLFCCHCLLYISMGLQGIVMEDGKFLHVGPPTIRLLPVELLLEDKRSPKVFRPNLSLQEREQLIKSLQTLIGHKYDTVRVYSFVFR